MKAIILAGNDGETQEDAAFLRLAGRPLLLYVLAALDGVEAVKEIRVIGARKHIMRVIETAMPEFFFSKTIRVETPPSNPRDLLWVPDDAAPRESEAEASLKLFSTSHYRLLLPGNIPLLTSGEIEAFLHDADLTDHDMALGLCNPPASGHSGAPDQDKAAASLASFKSGGEGLRHNNMILFRPFKNGRDPGQKLGQNTRGEKTEDKGKDPRQGDVSALLDRLLVKETGPETIRLTSAQGPKKELEDLISNLLKVNIHFIETKSGFSALHAENPSDVEKLSRGLADWRETLAALSKKDGHACPFTNGGC